VLIPLRARDQVLGLLALVVCTLRRHDAAADLALAQVFAARVAAAVDNACLYEESRRATRTRDHVLGIVSHDLRNPLSAIGMSANALSTATALGSDERVRLVATIRDAVTWMQRLLGDLVDVAAIEAGRLSMNPRRVDPVVLLGRSLNLFEQSATGVMVQLAPEVPEWLPAIVADEERILQVLANLISNARKVTPATGVITLGARAVDGAVRFSIADSGPGIPREHHQRIFDWFWRASHERAERGTGLGLAIAKGIVDAHGGRIEVESTPGHGATFSFTVPTARPTTITSDPAAAARASA
jgi:signal transduction histidine kinase